MKMKNFALVLIIMLISFLQMTCSAYTPYKFRQLEDAIGQTVGIHNGISTVLSLTDNLYVKNKKGKFKKAKDQNLDISVIWAPNVFRVEGKETDGKKEYLCLKDTGDNYYYILIDYTFNSKVLPYITSYSVLEAGLNDLNESHGFVLSPNFNYDSDEYSLKYIPVVWESVTIGEKTYDEPIYTVKIGNKCETEALSYLEKLYKFKSVKDRESDIKKEKSDSIADYNLYPCTIKKRELADGVPCQAYAFYIDKYKDSVYVYNNLIPKSFSYRSVQFDNANDMDFLKNRGKRGMETRRIIAMNKDSAECVTFYRNKMIQDSLRADSIQRRAEELQKFIDDLKKHKIFILDEDYCYGDYGQFGKKVEFFNCFNKTIKYIHLTFTAYNGVGDVQRDDIGRSTAKGRCIGPIGPGDIGTYSFDDLFWDDRDIIKRVYLTAVTFEFMDGTKVNYNGRKQIDAHKTSALYK